MEFIDNEKTSKFIQYDEELGIYHRGAGDLGIWKEQTGWKLICGDLTDEDRILDLGAHIGLMPVFANKLSGSSPSYLSVEPDPNNLRVLHKNKVQSHRIIEAAVVSEIEGPIDLYLGKTYPAANSTRAIRGRTKVSVETVKWKDLLEFNPTVVKCDIEGAEYLLDWRLLPKSVEYVGFEFHFFKDGDKEAMNVIRDDLRNLGFKELKSPKVNNFSKVTFGIFKRGL